jgi:hypothetical protein
MAPLSPGLSSVRRGIGTALVFFLLGCAVVFYRTTSGFPTLGSAAPASASAFASGDPTTVATQPAPSSAQSASADLSPATEPTPPSSPTTPGAGDNTGSGSAGEQTIQLEKPPNSAKPFETVRIRGTYRGGAGTFLRVQRFEGGIWLDFPVPTKTDRSGEFTAYVEMGQPGSYWLRVCDPDSDVDSDPFPLIVRA